MRRIQWILAVASAALILAGGGWFCAMWLGPAWLPVSSGNSPAVDQSADSAAAPRAALSPNESFEPNATERAEAADGPGAAAESEFPRSPATADVRQAATSHRLDFIGQAEALLLEGTYAAAQAHLDAAAAAHLAGERVTYLRGVCAEFLGNLAAAQAAYELAAATAETPGARRQAQLAYARILERQGRHDVVVETLYRDLLRSGSAEFDALDADAAHLLAITLGEQCFLAAEQSDLYRDDVLAPARLPLDARRLLTAPAAAPPSFPAVEPVPLEVHCRQRLGDHPGEVYVSLRGTDATIVELLTRIGDVLGRPLTCPAAVVRDLGARTLSLDVDEMDLALALDAVLSPLGLAWIPHPDRIEIAAASELPEDRRRELQAARTRRVVQLSLLRSPDHPWAAAQYALLGRLAAGEDQLDVALQFLRQARQASRGRRLPEASFNEGKLAMRMGDPAGAKLALYSCVDSIDAHPIKPAAYIYLGRLHLEADSPHEAVAPLQRAVQLTADSPAEPLAVTLLGSALLLDGNPQGAIAVLHNHRQRLNESRLREAAAFITAYAKFSAARTGDLRSREAAGLLEAVSRIDPAVEFGGHWWYLTAETFREFGITIEADRISQAALQAAPRSALRDRLVQRTLREQMQRDPSIAVDAAMTSLLSTADQTWRYEARLAVAETEYRRGLDEPARTHCRAIVQDATAPDHVRRGALRLLGRIHQQRREHDAALQCFAGSLPGGPLPTVDVEALSRPRVAGGAP